MVFCHSKLNENPGHRRGSGGTVLEQLVHRPQTAGGRDQVHALGLCSRSLLWLLFQTKTVTKITEIPCPLYTYSKGEKRQMKQLSK